MEGQKRRSILELCLLSSWILEERREIGLGGEREANFSQFSLRKFERIDKWGVLTSEQRVERRCSSS